MVPEASPRDMSGAPYYPCALENTLVCNAHKTTVSNVRRNEGIFTSRDIGVAGQLDRFQSSGWNVFIVGVRSGTLARRVGECTYDLSSICKTYRDALGLCSWLKRSLFVVKDFLGTRVVACVTIAPRSTIPEPPLS